jgi:hypothetical protein
VRLYPCIELVQEMTVWVEQEKALTRLARYVFSSGCKYDDDVIQSVEPKHLSILAQKRISVFGYWRPVEKRLL